MLERDSSAAGHHPVRWLLAGFLATTLVATEPVEPTHAVDHRYVVHLHDEDVLDRLSILASGTAIRIEARFDPLDRERPRGTRVDFLAGRSWERRDAFAHTLEEVTAR